MIFHLMHIIHVLTVILWIGGLAFVTMMVFPVIFKTPEPLQKVLLFQRIEHRFARVARVYNLITGITGFAMVFYMGWHTVYFTRAGIPLLVMTLIWLFWLVMLFGLEPIIIRRMLDTMVKERETMDIDGIFRKMNRMHWALLAASLVAATAGAVFAHGPIFF
ncbi:MAG TPA: hypothetical protein VJM57_09500 [Thermodesulfobacteriota bacterium]|nr:hypothetical protein [Thermodesulfobacteriota bacterium]